SWRTLRFLQRRVVQGKGTVNADVGRSGDSVIVAAGAPETGFPGQALPLRHSNRKSHHVGTHDFGRCGSGRCGARVSTPAVAVCSESANGTGCDIFLDHETRTPVDHDMIAPEKAPREARREPSCR